MARARNIKPGFFLNELLVEQPFCNRLLFVGLWTIADKAGRLEYRPKKIKMAIFPADDVDIESGIAALVKSGFLLAYTVENSEYLQIINWDKHQSPHHTERESSLPKPTNNGYLTVKTRKDLRENPPDSLIPDSLIPDSKPSVGKPPLSEGFETFWKAYPKKVGKGAAEKAWLKAKVNGELKAVLEAVGRQSRSEQWLKDGGQFIPNPATWIGQKRWLDGETVEIDLKPQVKLCCECHKNPVSVNTRGGICHACL